MKTTLKNKDFFVKDLTIEIHSNDKVGWNFRQLDFEKKSGTVKRLHRVELRLNRGDKWKSPK